MQILRRYAPQDDKPLKVRRTVASLWVKGSFITGTDTGVGKTYVTCGLAALLRESGYRVGVMKPAETGCDGGDGKLVPQDALALKAAAGCESFSGKNLSLSIPRAAGAERRR